MEANYDPRYPNIGDVIGCSDGDIGIVLRTYFDDYQLMVEVSWSVANATLTDPWRAKDFVADDDMFHIMSKA